MTFNLWSSFFASLLLIFAGQCSGKPLLTTIKTFPQLSQLQSYIDTFPSLAAALETVDNYTLFAPTNNAFEAWLKTATPKPTLSDIEATLFYHLVHGTFPVASFTTAPQFVSSFLSNTSYTNVTTGQVVQISLSEKQFPILTSGNGANTSISSTVRPSLLPSSLPSQTSY